MKTTNVKITKKEMMRRRKRTISTICVIILSIMIIIPFVLGQTKNCINTPFVIFYVCTLALGAISEFKENGLLLTITIVQTCVLMAWVGIN